MPNKHLTNTRKSLMDLALMSAKTDEAERRILRSAQSRLADVEKQLQRARQGVEAAPDDEQDRYTDLVHEAGQLRLVIARAEGVIAQQV